jgi:hypothetical protein
MLVTVARFSVRSETGASVAILVLAIATVGAAFLMFVVTTLVTEPRSIVTLAVILALSVAFDFG